MKLIYIDEAGNTGAFADPDQPLHMIGSLIVDESEIRSLQQALEVLADKYAEVVTTATGGREVPGFGRMPYTAADIEFHGSELFGGKKLSERVKPGERVACCHAILNACKQAQAQFGSCTIDKMKLTVGHPHMWAFQFTLERLQDRLAAENQRGLIIADEHRELEEQIIRDLSFSQSSNTGRGWRPTQITNIVDTVHFVKSHHNRIVQACDVMTYFRLKGQRVQDRLLREYLAMPVAVRGIWTNFRNTRAKPAEQAVLDLYDEIHALEVFTKQWPP